MPKVKKADPDDWLSFDDGLERFAATFKRNNRGNLWKRHSGMILTIFSREDFGFGFCIRGQSPKFSASYPTEDAAMEALFHALDGDCI
jgi:hypothetical protein